MDFIGIVILGSLGAGGLGLLCVVVPTMRRFTLAALVSPVVASFVLMIGAMILADMNPAREYGADHIPNGSERDPTKSEYALWLFSVAATFVVSAAVCTRLQPLLLEAVQDYWGEPL